MRQPIKPRCENDREISRFRDRGPIQEVAETKAYRLPGHRDCRPCRPAHSYRGTLRTLQVPNKSTRWEDAKPLVSYSRLDGKRSWLSHTVATSGELTAPVRSWVSLRNPLLHPRVLARPLIGASHLLALILARLMRILCASPFAVPNRGGRGRVPGRARCDA